MNESKPSSAFARGIDVGLAIAALLVEEMAVLEYAGDSELRPAAGERGCVLEEVSKMIRALIKTATP